MHCTRLVKYSWFTGVALIDTMWSSSSWMKPVQFTFWKLKCCWKGTVDGAITGVMQMLIGRCCVLGIALRTPFFAYSSDFVAWKGDIWVISGFPYPTIKWGRLFSIMYQAKLVGFSPWLNSITIRVRFSVFPLGAMAIKIANNDLRLLWW